MLGRRAGDAAKDLPEDRYRIAAFDDLLELARRRRRLDDPSVRQKLARLWCHLQTGTWNAQRAKAEAASGGGGSVASIGKLAQTRIVKLAAEIGMDILGPDGMLMEGDDTRFVDAYLFAPATSIYGGTDEIQRNIVAERTLGLPREANVEKGLSFSESLRRQQRQREASE